MTNLEQSNAQDERSQEDALDGLKIADLRRVAKILGIAAQRDWATEDFVEAIKEKQNSNSVPSLVFDNSLAPRPGYARILVYRDMTPGHKNTPIHVGLNGWLFQVPRGIEVDVPAGLVSVLNDARSLVTSQTIDEDTNRIKNKESMVQSYPFQVLAISPGVAKNPHDNRGAKAKLKQEFCDKFERFPTDGELAKWLEKKMDAA